MLFDILGFCGMSGSLDIPKNLNAPEIRPKKYRANFRKYPKKFLRKLFNISPTETNIAYKKIPEFIRFSTRNLTSARVSLLRVEIENEISQGNFWESRMRMRVLGKKTFESRMRMRVVGGKLRVEYESSEKKDIWDLVWDSWIFKNVSRIKTKCIVIWFLVITSLWLKHQNWMKC